MFETIIEKTARVLTGQYGVTVVFQGTGARTNGKQISLPALPREGLTSEFVKQIHGYLDHESAHCLFTQFKAIARLDPRSYHFFLMNHCEDSRIEKKMLSLYPGSYLYLVPLNDMWNRIALERWSELPRLQRIALNIRGLVDGTGIVRLDPDTQHVFTKKVHALCRKLENAQSTAEVVRFTAQLVKEMKLTLEQKPEQQEQQKEKDAAEGEGGDEGDSDENSEESEDSAGVDAAEGEGGDEGDSDENSEESEKESAESSGDSEDPRSNDSDEDSEGEGKDGDSAPCSEVDNFKPNTEVPTDIHAFMDGKFAELQEKVEEAFEQAKVTHDFSNVPHLSASTIADKEHEVITDRYTETAWRSQRQKISAPASRISVDLHRLLAAQDEDDIETHQRSGRMSPSAVSRLLLDKQYTKPFERTTSSQTGETVLTFLCDVSASMGEYNKIGVLRDVLATLSVALQQNNVKFEILSFSTNNRNTYDGDKTHNRFVALDHEIVKDFHSHSLVGISALRPKHNSSEGESLRWAASRISKQRADRRIILAMSDGMPFMATSNSAILHNDLLKAVKEVTANGIEVVGVGICSASVESFYPDHIVVSNVNDLLKSLSSKLRTILTPKNW